MTLEQGKRIMTALAYPDEGRDVRALVTEDNLVEYGWISTRIELDTDQLYGQKSGPKRTKVAAVPSTQAAQPKTATASRLSKGKARPRLRRSPRLPSPLLYRLRQWNPEAKMSI